ncbi:MAG TPA: shikimate dehydrogenase [Anaerolineales bacterium]|nr:shikimate dehydrogenase [Anaerolineales bacterium]
MIKLGLIGYPLGHSLSPRIHEAALRSTGLGGNYSLFPIEPDNRQALKDLLARVRMGEITGLNVTIPHKQNVIPMLDELTPTAKAIGAANTIFLRDHKLVGDNTDAPGFLADLNRFLAAETQRHEVLDVLILGAGGSARAVLYALSQDGWSVTISARRLEQAEALVRSFAPYKLQITNYELSNIDLSTVSLIVNTTPVGMIPNIARSPWPENVPFPPQAAIYDLVYNPRETKLVRDAHHQGLHATTGLGMLIEQAALSFQIWTNQRPSREAMRAATEQSPVSNY